MLHLHRVQFYQKLDKSVFHEGALNPVIESLMYALWVGEGISATNSILLDKSQKKVLRELLHNIRKGRLSFIDLRIHTTAIILAVLKKYLQSQQDTPLQSKRYLEWSKLVSGLPTLRDSLTEKSLKTQNGKAQAKMLLQSLPEGNQIFLNYFITLLHKIAVQSGNIVLGSLRLAEFLGSVILLRTLKSLKVQVEAETILQFLIIHAPQLFGCNQFQLRPKIPVFNRER
ncbi:uncharacterized protein LOC143254431 [Tachypleus tridentatus]|uniref:uncharacterized protein LOC143254431 n=1 Tax=Tachypleus tridentatus TaxID=6853 RepID=UPI003FD5AEF4